MHAFFSKQLNKIYKKDTLIENYKKILIASMPVTPHLSNECLKLLDVNEISWPSFDEAMLIENFVNIVIQINGKKRGIVQTRPEIEEEDLLKLIKSDQKIFKYLDNKPIKKKIYIKNKLLNMII